jgi:hypothetical protein
MYVDDGQMHALAVLPPKEKAPVSIAQESGYGGNERNLCLCEKLNPDSSARYCSDFYVSFPFYRHPSIFIILGNSTGSSFIEVSLHGLSLVGS